MLTLYKRGKSRAWWMRLRLISGVDIRRSTGHEDREKAELAALDSLVSGRVKYQTVPDLL